MSAWAEKRREEAHYKSDRREAARPLKEMLRGTSFRVRFTRDVRFSTSRVKYVVMWLDPWWSRLVPWEDCSDRALIARLQKEMLAEAEDWLTRCYGEVVTP